MTEHGKIAEFFLHCAGIPTGAALDADFILAHLIQIPLHRSATPYQNSNFGLTAGVESVAASRGRTWAQAPQ